MGMSVRRLDTQTAGTRLIYRFARTFSLDEFSREGLMLSVVEASVSFSERRGTLRGMHYQAEPHPESKLVRCSRGKAFDVALDLRVESPTYLRWHGELLTADNRAALYIPTGCAHGFVTLED
jgi:dTDP-4-dehydrorhamnose 3,5-epimerase